MTDLLTRAERALLAADEILADRAARTAAEDLMTDRLREGYVPLLWACARAIARGSGVSVAEVLEDAAHEAREGERNGREYAEFEAAHVARQVAVHGRLRREGLPVSEGRRLDSEGA